jgi:hypothetical protein
MSNNIHVFEKSKMLFSFLLKFFDYIITYKKFINTMEARERRKSSFATTLFSQFLVKQLNQINENEDGKKETLTNSRTINARFTNKRIQQTNNNGN